MPISLLFAAVLLAAPAEKPKLLVLDLNGAGGAEPQVVSAFTEAVTSAVAARGVFEVMSSRDVTALLGVERQKQLLCSDESSSCLGELSGALGARFVLSGSLARLGDAWQLTLSTLDTQTTKPLGRTIRIAANLAALQGQLPWAVSEATATPSPAPPSRVLPISLLAVGGAAVVGGGVFGVQALSNEASLQKELNNLRPGALDSRDSYLSRAADQATMKTVSVLMLVGGAALAATGAVLLKLSGDSGASASLVPTANGAALVGVFP